MSLGREFTPISCSRAATPAPDNADTDNEDSSKSCYSCGPSNENIGGCRLVALVGGLCPPHDATNDAPQGSHDLSAIGNVITGGE